MALDIWPSSLPNPDASGYTFEPEDALARTPMDAGANRVRRLYTTTPVILTVRWQMAAAELKTFRTFYHTTIQDGSERFTMPVWADDAYEDQEVRFLAPYRATYLAVDLWEVRGQLQILDTISNA